VINVEETMKYMNVYVRSEGLIAPFHREIHPKETTRNETTALLGILLLSSKEEKRQSQEN
jgi:hypothetical protein